MMREKYQILCFNVEENDYEDCLVFVPGGFSCCVFQLNSRSGRSRKSTLSPSRDISGTGQACLPNREYMSCSHRIAFLHSNVYDFGHSEGRMP